MPQTNGLRPLPVRDFHNCFGCGPRNTHGLKMRFYTDEKSLYSWVEIPGHFSGWKDFAHGGVITTMLDEVMGWSALHLLKTMVLTKSITVDFVKPVHVNREVKLVGTVLERRNDREAVMEGALYDANGELCSKAVGTFALFPPEIALKFGILDETDIVEVSDLFSA